MNDINTLKDTWMKQSLPQHMKVLREDYISRIPDRLKKYQKFQDRVNTVKMVLVLLILLLFAWMLFQKMTLSAPVIAGFFLIVGGTPIFGLYYLKKQFRLSSIDFTSDSAKFIPHAIVKLKSQISVFRLPFFLYLTVMISGLNVMYYALLEDSPVKERLVMHVGITVLIFFMALIGLVVRKRRYKKETQPVIDELINLSNELHSETDSE